MVAMINTTNSTDTHVALYKAEWTKFEGVTVLRVPGSRFIAVPTTGRKNSSRFDILDVKGSREAFECQLTKKEVNNWLCAVADSEGCKPYAMMERISY